MASPEVGAFLLASAVLAATPGPGVIYIVARTLAQGRAAGLASVAGVALGNFGNALAASLGLAALFAVSPGAFTLVRLAGAAYLVGLGVQALRAPASAQRAAPPAAVPVARLVRDGAGVALLNPKTTLFFAAFLPQFIDPQGSAVAQSVGLGAAFVALAACTDSLYVLAAAATRPRVAALERGARWGRWASAAVYIGLGVYTALSGSRSAK